MRSLMLWIVTHALLMSVTGSRVCTQRSNFCKIIEGNVLVEVNADAVIGTIDEAFLCATLDWWPPDKCDYGTCSWDHASLLNLDLANPLLERALAALSPMHIRLGGTLQDQIVYDIGSPAQPCLPLVKDDAHMFGFRGGCLPMERWSALNALFARTGSLVAFGLNALYNRQQTMPGVWGPWDSSNARDFITFTFGQGIQVQAWELGNELTAYGVGTTIAPEQYAEDVKELRTIVNNVYHWVPKKPVIVAPDGFLNPEWYNKFLQTSGPGVVDVVTRHIYNLGPGVSTDLVEKILDPAYLDNEVGDFQAVQQILQTTGRGAAAWVGEAGGAYNSGHHLVTDAFVFSFWYLDQLGMAASFNNKVYCRQSFIGGNYGLLNTSTFEPNPDYYSALLWRQLMGTKVLSTKFLGAPKLRAYTHCQKGTTTGGLTILLINLSNTTTTVDVGVVSYQLNKSKSHVLKKVKSFLVPKGKKVITGPTTRLEYHVSAPDNNLNSQTVLLNGLPLQITAAGSIPPLDPIIKENLTPISVAPFSIAFVALPEAWIPICAS